MIKTRLVGLLSHAKKYIVYTILWQWLALLSQVMAVFSIAGLLEKVVYGKVTAAGVQHTGPHPDPGRCDPFLLRADGRKILLSGLRGCKEDPPGKDLRKNAEAWRFLQRAGFLL